MIGDTVNIASRVEGLNKTLNTELLLTSTTLAQVEKSGCSVEVQELGSHSVRGRSEDVEVYTVEVNHE